MDGLWAIVDSLSVKKIRNGLPTNYTDLCIVQRKLRKMKFLPEYLDQGKKLNPVKPCH